MPHSAKLDGAAEGLPLELVYLRTDSEERWRSSIASHQVGGTHIYVPKKAHSELMKLFNGRYFLTYVLLQADGTGKLDVARPWGLNRQTLEALLK